MRDRSIIPTNLADWPRVAGLLPELKLILGLGLWGGRYTSCIGVFLVPMRPLAASLGLDPAALESGIRTLCSAHLVVADWETGELFICDWFRFHFFKGAGISIAKREFLKISSHILRCALIKSAPWLAEESGTPQSIGETHNKQQLNSPTAAARPIAAATEKIRIRRASGIVTFLPSDPERANQIERAYDCDQISSAVSVIEGRSKEPVPGLVLKEIESRAKKVAREKTQLLNNARNNQPTLSRNQREPHLLSIWAAIEKKTP